MTTLTKAGQAADAKAFQSTSPVWGMTAIQTQLASCCCVSIHIPRVGDDLDLIAVDTINERFQSTSPVWGMTQNVADCFSCLDISIHIPRVGDDIASLTLGPDYERFQSTSPVWGMTGKMQKKYISKYDFNPHPPCGG